MAKVAGTAYFRINGASYSTTGDWNIEIQDEVREPIVAADGSVHFSASAAESKISGSLITTPTLIPSLVADIEDATIQVELQNGRVALLQDAFFSGKNSVGSKSGEMSVEFTGRGRWL